MAVSLKQRLFTHLLFIITVFVIISGIIYGFNVINIIDEKNKIELEHDKVVLNTYFDNLESSLKKISNEITQDLPIATSLNLISNYENPEEYNHVVFDTEKKQLLKYLNKWLKESDTIAVSFFNIKGELIAINRKSQKQITDIGYVSYDDNKNKVFKNQEDDTYGEMPLLASIDTKSINSIGGNAFPDRYVLKNIKAVYLHNKIVGYVQVEVHIDIDAVKKVNRLLTHKFILKVENEKFLYGNFQDKQSLSLLQDSDIYELVPVSIPPINGVFVIDKSYIKTYINKVFIEMVIQWGIGIVILLILVYKFIFKYITEPLEKLKRVINKMKNKEFITLKPNNNNDEIGQILGDVNSLSLELKQSLSLLDDYKDVMDDSLIVTKADRNGMITYANDNFVKVSGYTQKEAIGRPHSIIRHPDTPKELFQGLWKTIQMKKSWKGLIKNRGKNGTEYWVKTIIKPLLDSNGEIEEYIAVRYDVTELMEQKEQLRTLLHTDSLTGLANRLQLNNDIKNSKIRALAIINIDNFRQVNDFYGHAFGDKLIVELGHIISALCKHEEYIKLYRLDGDEFAILSSIKDKMAITEKIQNIIRFIEHDNIMIDKESVTLKLTAGISFEDKEHILQTAGMALQSARKLNQEIIIYSEENSLNKEYENNLLWTKKIKEAIEDFRVVPYFQPIVQNSTLEVVKYEALIRIMDKETNKPVSPFFFLEIAKKTKYYTILTKIMIEKTFEAFRNREEEFSINLTVEDVLNSEIQDYIFELLNRYEIGNRVVFEIVESESIENFDGVSGFINHIKKFGCQIAIDDFGTGYSNFAYLMKLQADYIKIDGSMIKDIDSNENSRLVVETIVSFAKKMGMKVIAEFVENESILNIVKELGIEYSQGYHFSPPKKELD